MSSQLQIDNLVNDLQIRQAFQDDSLSSLNEMVAVLQREVSDLRKVVIDLKQSFAENRQSTNAEPNDFVSSGPPHF